MAKLVSGRVKNTPQTGITSDRYDFLGLEQAEPNLGDPQIGVSSVGANPHPPGGQYLLANVGGQTGKRYWISVDQLNLGIRDPGTFTIFNNGVQVGIANSFNVFNFVGTGVTVDPVGPNPEDQTGIATVRIVVTDLLAPGDEYEIPYHDPITGFLKGSDGFVYRNGSVGIGSTIPTAKLNVVGNTIITGITTLGTLQISSGIVTANSGIITYYGEFFGPITGTASTASFATTSYNLVDASGILAGTISSSRLSGTYGINVTGSASTASFATTAFNLTDAAGITTGFIDPARLTGTYDINISGTAQQVIQIVDQVVDASSLSVSGLSTFRSPVGIATTTSPLALTVESYTFKTGIGTFIASAGIGYTVDTFNVDTYDFKTAEYTFHFEYDNIIQSQKILVMQNKTSAYGQEYGIMYEPTKLVSIAATISGSECLISVVPETGVEGLTTYRFMRGAMY
jgi:hypothetical protein